MLWLGWRGWASEGRALSIPLRETLWDSLVSQWDQNSLRLGHFSNSNQGRLGGSNVSRHWIDCPSQIRVHENIKRCPVEEVPVEADIHSTLVTPFSKICTLTQDCVSWEKRAPRENMSNSNKGFICASSDPWFSIPDDRSLLTEQFLSQGCFSLFTLVFPSESLLPFKKYSLE